MPLMHTMVGSLPCVMTTVRFLAFWDGISDKRVAMNSMSVVSQPSVSAQVCASVSLPKRKSTKGMVSTNTFLKGGTCMMKGADKFMQYRAPVFMASWDASLIDAGDTVMKKPAL